MPTSLRPSDMIRIGLTCMLGTLALLLAVEAMQSRVVAYMANPALAEAFNHRADDNHALSLLYGLCTLYFSTWTLLRISGHPQTTVPLMIKIPASLALLGSTALYCVATVLEGSRMTMSDDLFLVNVLPGFYEFAELAFAVGVAVWIVALNGLQSQVLN